MIKIPFCHIVNDMTLLYLVRSTATKSASIAARDGLTQMAVFVIARDLEMIESSKQLVLEYKKHLCTVFFEYSKKPPPEILELFED